MRLLLSVLLFCTACIGPADAQRVIHRERSQYRNLQVIEEGGQRCLLFVGPRRSGRESCRSLEDPDRLVFDYTRIMMGALYVNPSPRNVLIIGLGGGSLPMAMHRAAPNANIVAVEIDPAVVRVAERYFGFRTDARLSVVVQDGRVFVNRALQGPTRYDIIMLDAFDNNYIPDHLMTLEFLQSVRQLLTPNGVLAANTFSSSGLYDNESVTYAAVFTRYFNIRRGNRIIMASPAGLPPPEVLQANSRTYERAFSALGINRENLLAMMREDRDWDTRARVLTDEYSPANLLNQQRRRRG